MVARATGQHDHAGLVSALDRWITDEAERHVVWERILPTPDGAAIAPVLICPEHASLRCTVIVAEVIAAEVIADGGLVEWARIGIDRSDPREPGRVGTSVEWIAGLGPLRFQRAAYADFLTMCKLAHADDAYLRAIEIGERLAAGRWRGRLSAGPRTGRSGERPAVFRSPGARPLAPGRSSALSSG